MSHKNQTQTATVDSAMVQELLKQAEAEEKVKQRAEAMSTAQMDGQHISAMVKKVRQIQEDDEEHTVQGTGLEGVPRTHRTEQISDLELGAVMKGMDPDRLKAQGARTCPDEVPDFTHTQKGYAVPEEAYINTVKWNRDAVAKIVSEEEAAALMELSSSCEDDAPRLEEDSLEEDTTPEPILTMSKRIMDEEHEDEVSNTILTHRVSDRDLDRLMENAARLRPVSGHRGARAHTPAPHTPQIALLEEKMPGAVSRTDTGSYRAGGNPPPRLPRYDEIYQDNASAQSTQTLLIILIALVVLIAIGNIIYMMYPK